MSDMIDAGGTFPPSLEGDPVNARLDEHWIISMILICAAVILFAALTVAVVGRTLGGV